MRFNSLEERNQFIENNLGLVANRTRKLNGGMFNDDLYQVGSIALIEATDRFDKSGGNEFSTYAVKYIDGYILKYKRYNSLIKPLQERGKWNFFYKDVASINEKVSGNETSLEDTISSNEDIEQFVIDKIAVRSFLNNLSDRDRLIIELVMDGVKQSKISQMVCINQSNVSRIVNRGGKQYMSSYAT